MAVIMPSSWLRGTQVPNKGFAFYLVLWLVSLCFANPSAGLDFFSQSQEGHRTQDLTGTKSIIYKNREYRFRFKLPRNWKHCSISICEWEGGDGKSYSRGDVMPPPVKGPLISIHHPLSTESCPRQDIPIMVFTMAQWDLVEEGKLVVSAAPIGPIELGHNAKYVFALPPRYGYAFSAGWEEVNDIIQSDPLQTF